MDDMIKSAPPASEKPVKGADSHSSHSGSDIEKQDVKVGQTVQLQRRLQSRHLQMIAIGGTIGTGMPVHD
jgi:amino acid transporter